MIYLILNYLKLHNNIRRLQDDTGIIQANTFAQNVVLEHIHPTVDLAVVATISSTERRELDNDNFSAILDLKDIIVGEVNSNLFDGFVRLK